VKTVCILLLVAEAVMHHPFPSNDYITELSFVGCIMQTL